MIIVLFGKPGTGKSSLGKYIARKYNFKFFECDDYLTKEILTCIKKNKIITDAMRDKYYKKVIGELKKIKGDVVVSDAIPKDKYRKLFLDLSGDVMLFYLHANKKVILQRLKSRSRKTKHVVDDKYLNKIEEYFEAPKINCVKINSSRTIKETCELLDARLKIFL